MQPREVVHELADRRRVVDELTRLRHQLAQPAVLAHPAVEDQRQHGVRRRRGRVRLQVAGDVLGPPGIAALDEDEPPRGEQAGRVAGADRVRRPELGLAGDLVALHLAAFALHPPDQPVHDAPHLRPVGAADQVERQEGLLVGHPARIPARRGPARHLPRRPPPRRPTAARRPRGGGGGGARRHRSRGPGGGAGRRARAARAGGAAGRRARRGARPAARRRLGRRPRLGRARHPVRGGGARERRDRRRRPDPDLRPRPRPLPGVAAPPPPQGRAEAGEAPVGGGRRARSRRPGGSRRRAAPPSSPRPCRRASSRPPAPSRCRSWATTGARTNPTA